MIVAIDEQDLKSGVLGLVVALVEIITEALRQQALKRMEGGRLTQAEIERLGEALLQLEAAIDEIKTELGVAAAVQALRNQLDGAVEDALGRLTDPVRWTEDSRWT